MKDLAVSRPFNEDEYNDLLRQAVAVIETSRLQIAKQLNTVAMSNTNTCFQKTSCKNWLPMK